ncbi:DUF3800 domain-containing protein [Sphingobium sufflavum]|uniref:DUF3800 domain-containing protein n=1 Tax=Sphingobium sufflavum TaxID=1129547 RepID=UPI001F243084|nr:DUF3800 domain-containing protein [Sphingobium sufflavum]MCE7798768.1 DUF3800 domain-containing protein [Sphingobium sufflavum]
MPIYIDESGGLPAGAMTMAGVEIEEDAAEALLARFGAVSGLHGELKGSRIELIERAMVLELLERFGGRARICAVDRAALGDRPLPRDLDVYVALLKQLVEDWLPETDGCANFVVDEGRYDLLIQERVRVDVATLLDSCGVVRMVNSRASAGVQVADVVANCFFNLAIHSTRAERIGRIVAPFVESQILRLAPLRLPIVGTAVGMRG